MQVKELAKKLQEAHIIYIKDNIPELYWEFLARVALDDLKARGYRKVKFVRGKLTLNEEPK